MLSNRLNAEQIIRALTENAAKYLGVDGEVGTLLLGKRADLLTIAGESLRNLEDLKHVRMVLGSDEIVVDRR